MASPVGTLTLIAEDGCLTAVRFGAFEERAGEENLLKEAERQLTEYFSGVRKTFELPLNPAGTAFQKKVWDALLTVPYGKTATYGEIAKKIGSPRAARAVGMANHNNPLPIVVPCHRIIGSNGKLTGYGGGLEIKRTLLELERDK